MHVSAWNILGRKILIISWNLKWVSKQLLMDLIQFVNYSNFYEGFTKKLLLKRGAVPTVPKSANDELHKERAERIEKRENKKIVQKLIEEYDAGSALLTGI